jgi:formate hydrogenlyase transcriptional activator
MKSNGIPPGSHGPDGSEAVLSVRDLTAFQDLMESTAHATGEEFFRKLVRSLAEVLGVGFAFVAEFAGENRARTIAFWRHRKFVENIEWELAGTPCELVVGGELCHFPSGVWERFPSDAPLREWGIQSYLGVPLRDAQGVHMGHLAIFDPQPMEAHPRLLFIFRMFAARAAAELHRLRVELQLTESEQRFRDLFEEAPIAYVHEGLDSKFISANRAAMRILGITPEQVEGTVGMSFIPDTPDAQKRVREAFESIGRGTDTSGVVLELRRRDNGKPIWIQWWSKPDRSGKFTRTMFLDITDRVLMEQEQQRLQAQNLYLQEEIKDVHNFEEIVGRSPALMSVLEKIAQVAPTDTSVLITGETGTGKELLARAIHSASKRHDKPLIKVNCAALPEGLVESELFGHEKGAFTGAISRRIGRFELAEGGTLFLDEIGELPLGTQAKLLRVLQEREFERVGGSDVLKANVRILAATNRDLQKCVREKSFREDLYFRLNVFPLAMPALRQRREDIPLLVQFLVAKFTARIGKTFTSISAGSLLLLQEYHWPGNVRELENILERAIILSKEPELQIAADQFAIPATQPAPSELLSLVEVEKNHIVAILEQVNWVIEGPKGAAARLQMHPNTLRSRMKKFGIHRSEAIK